MIEIARAIFIFAGSFIFFAFFQWIYVLYLSVFETSAQAIIVTAIFLAGLFAGSYAILSGQEVENEDMDGIDDSSSADNRTGKKGIPYHR